MTADEGPVISDADADVLITEAVRRREEQRSGKARARQFRIVGGCVAAGLLLIAGGRFLGYAWAAAALVAGVLIIAVTGLLVLRALDLSPATQWGEPVGEPCPACGQRNLREGRVADGIVALCTEECGYAEVKPVMQPEPGGPVPSRSGDSAAGSATEYES